VEVEEDLVAAVLAEVTPVEAEAEVLAGATSVVEAAVAA
jgi:hypothetical protein